MSRILWALGMVGLVLVAGPVSAKEIPDEVRSLLAQHEWAAAVEPLSAFVEQDKKNVEAWTELGWCYYHLERYNDAAGPFKTAYELQKKNYSAAHGYARTLIELHQFDPAYKILNSACLSTTWACSSCPRDAWTRPT
jgi:cytochrome c-type biogenesis protein CcmH/NrfG